MELTFCEINFVDFNREFLYIIFYYGRIETTKQRRRYGESEFESQRDFSG